MTKQLESHENPLVRLRHTLTDRPPKGLWGWAALMDRASQCGVPACPMCTVAKTYVIGHSPYKSEKTFQTTVLRATRKAARAEISRLDFMNLHENRDIHGEIRWHIFEHQAVDALRMARMYRAATAAGIQEELLHRSAIRFRHQDQRLHSAIALWRVRNLGERRIAPIGRLVRMPIAGGKTTRLWSPDRLEAGPCCEPFLDAVVEWLDMSGQPRVPTSWLPTGVPGQPGLPPTGETLLRVNMAARRRKDLTRRLFRHCQSEDHLAVLFDVDPARVAALNIDILRENIS